MNPEQLKNILSLHGKFLRCKSGGVCANLSGANLSGADLRSANLGGVNLDCANLGDADLNGADLRSANLNGANLRSADLRSANLYLANLNSANLGGANLRGANLEGVNLGGANLRIANLRSANLSGANLGGADLSGADLGNANLDNSYGKLPIVKSLHAKMLKAIGDDASHLHMGSWHECATTHCRAGWVVTLAGDAGQALEWALGTACAAALIEIGSTPALDGKVPHYHCDKATALADIKHLAAFDPEVTE